MKKIYVLFLAFGLWGLSGCTHSVHQSHMGDFLPRKQKGARYFTVEAQKKVILGFNFNTDYVDEARRKLLAACSKQITGVNTQYITSHNFASYTEKIRIKALCLD